MKLTKEMIEKHDPCSEGLAWYVENGTDDLLETLLKVNEHKPEWARWLFTHLMTVRQRREIAIFSAEQVLPIFEEKYPNDDRPRKAIEAAKRVLEADTEENRKSAAAAYAAAYVYAAAYADDAAYAAAYADAAYAAAYADAAYAAAAYADAAAGWKRKEMQERIIYKAVELLNDPQAAKEDPMTPKPTPSEVAHKQHSEEKQHMSEEKLPKGDEELHHPCKQTCSGWNQGYEVGLRAGREQEAERVRELTAKLSAAEAEVERYRDLLEDAIDRFDRYGQVAARDYFREMAQATRSEGGKGNE